MVTITKPWGLAANGDIVEVTDTRSETLLVGAGSKVAESQAVEWGVPYTRENGELIVPPTVDEAAAKAAVKPKK